MSNRNEPQKKHNESCEEFGPDDGLDPREFVKKYRSKPRKTCRKDLQLCGQIMRALSVILTSCRDEVLQSLEVIDVAPAPNASRLLVTLGFAPSAESRDPLMALAHVEAASAKIRAELASEITRRKMPDLMYKMVD
jgi:ribosome-binding factor A